jgi:glycosyltransferase involved in cell wall biosynthesis
LSNWFEKSKVPDLLSPDVRILYGCDWFKEYAANIILAIPSDAHNISVIARSQTREFEGRREDEEHLHCQLENHCDRLSLLAGGRFSKESLSVIFRDYFGKRKESNYDILHLQSTYDPRFLWLAWRRPTVLTLHEPKPRPGLPRESGLRGSTRVFLRRAYRSLADLIIVHTVSGLSGLTPREARKAVVIPHGSDTRAANEQTPCDLHDSPTILFFGRVAAYKGIDTLLSAMERVWITRPDARLRILANPGDGIGGHDSAALDPRVTASWGGYSKSDLQKALYEARAVCLPYLSVSGSGVGAQALGWGKPIVASNLEGLRELASHDDLLVEPGNASDLARALLAVLSEDYKPRSLDPLRTWPAVAEAHLAAYGSLLARKSGQGIFGTPNVANHAGPLPR